MTLTSVSFQSFEIALGKPRKSCVSMQFLLQMWPKQNMKNFDPPLFSLVPFLKIARLVCGFPLRISISRLDNDTTKTLYIRFQWKRLTIPSMLWLQLWQFCISGVTLFRSSWLHYWCFIQQWLWDALKSWLDLYLSAMFLWMLKRLVLVKLKALEFLEVQCLLV